MKNILVCFLFAFLMLANRNCFADTVKSIIDRTSVASTEYDERRRYWVDFALKTNVSFVEKGFQVGAGYRWEFLGVGLRASYGSTTYGQFKAREDSTQTTGGAYHAGTLGVEMLRPRNDSDAWKYFTFEPGITVEAKLFYNLLPQLSEKGRFGLIFGRFTDQANTLSFASYLWNLEGSLIYQVRVNSPWSVEASLFWNSGNLMLNSDDSSSDRHLAANWVGTTIGVQYSF